MKTKISLLLLALLPAAILAADPDKLAISGVAQMYWANGNPNNSWNGGGTTQADLFDGNYRTGVHFPYDGKGGDNMYMVFNLAALPAGKYYVTQFKVWQAAAHQYSLYYLEDGASEYAEVEGAVGVSYAGLDGAAYDVGKVCTKVKIVFNKLTGWSPGTSEIEVWGIDPAQMSCPHSAFTEWEPVDGSATCTKRGVDRHKCLSCGEFFERPSELLPALGHAYVTTLTTPGTSASYGSGAMSCERCDWSAIFNVPVDLTTLGGVVSPGIVQFTDLSVSSEWHPEWGPCAANLIDGIWTEGYGWCPGSRSHDDEWADYDFGTEIDLTKIDVSVPNRTQTLEFYKVEGDEETETLVGTVQIAAGSGSYQRRTVEFRGVSLKKLRLRVTDATGTSLWGRSVIQVFEFHPYGTVVGAGRLDVLRTRIFLY
jgi:hypothetical protein